jgi:hypothetical protein
MTDRTIVSSLIGRGIKITVAYFEALSHQLLRVTKTNHETILQPSRCPALFSVETEILPSDTRRLAIEIQVGKMFNDFKVLNDTHHGVKHLQHEDRENDLQLWR